MTYIFDIDGTLTPSRLRIDETFERFFLNFINYKKVWLITGSDKDKTIEQVGEEIWNNVDRAYQCCGNQVWSKGELLKQNDWEIPLDLRFLLEQMLDRSDYPHRFGNHIEERVGLVNFSVVGRNCSQEHRETYFEWDDERSERLEFTKEIKKSFPGIDASVGGQISIDIHPIGRDKGQIIDDIDGNFTFFGDKLEEGGNDYPVLLENTKRELEGNEFFSVKSWKETNNLLLSILQQGIL